MKLEIKRFSCIVVVFAIMALYSSTVFSAVPEIINYQGSLSDAGGNPVSSTLNITFTLYDVAAGPGSILWQEVQSVTVTNGQFSVQLGADINNPLDIALFEDPLFLGLAVGGDAEMTPRQALTAVGYAVRSKTVESDTLNSLSCAANEIPKFIGGVWVCAADENNTDTNAATICPNGTFLNGDGSCDPVVIDTNTTYSAGSGLALNGTTFSIPTNGINASHLAANSVGASEIAISAVGASEIATGAVASNEVLDNSLTAADLGPNSVGTSEVANNSLTSDDLASDSVSINELADLARGVGVNGSIIIPASAFQAWNNTESFSFVANGYLRMSSLNDSMCVVAPVVLPHGVTVTHFEISATDNSASENVRSFSLVKKNFSSGASANMATVSSTGALPGIRVFADISIVDATVDAFNFHYHIFGCIDSDNVSTFNTLLHAARIRYN